MSKTIEVIQKIKISDIVRNYALTENPDKAEKRILTWTTLAKRHYNFSDDILKFVLLIALRTKKDHSLPINNYLNKILANFKKFDVCTIEDAAKQYENRIAYELEKQKIKQETKQHFQNKTVAQTIKYKRMK